MKVYIKANNTETKEQYINFFKYCNFDIVDQAVNADIIVFTNDERIDSKIYGVNSKLNSNITEKSKIQTLSNLLTFNEFYNKKKFICFNSSALFFAKLSGSKIIHKVHEHYNYHFIQFKNMSDCMLVNSSHNQMIYPFNLNKDDYTVFANSYPSVSSGRYFKNDVNEPFEINFSNFREPEIVYFNNTQVLCIMFKVSNQEYQREKLKNLILKTI